MVIIVFFFCGVRYYKAAFSEYHDSVKFLYFLLLLRQRGWFSRGSRYRPIRVGDAAEEDIRGYSSGFQAGNLHGCQGRVRKGGLGCAVKARHQDVSRNGDAHLIAILRTIWSLSCFYFLKDSLWCAKNTTPGAPRPQFRRLNRRKSAQRTLLVSLDLTADEISATGSHRRFRLAPIEPAN